MGHLIRQDSYWFVDGEGEDATMRAVCPICAKKAKKGWFWEGRLGYGDYDLFCHSCGNAIYIRGEDDSKASNKGQEQQTEGRGVDREQASS